MMRRILKSIRHLIFVVLTAFLTSCGGQGPASDDVYREVDELFDSVLTGSPRFKVIAEIDHSRLAAAEGEVMPPARVIIFSDAAVNIPILQLEPRAGLDLPFRVLAYAENDSSRITYTTAEFLQRRYGLEFGPELQQYQDQLMKAVAPISEDAIVEMDASRVGEGMGIVTLNSDYDFNQTISRLKDTILEESDTVWFGEIDYQEEAAAIGVDLPPLKLLLWGAPVPGAKAMREFPRMGLDAFCQKTLVYQPPGETVLVMFNDMPAFAKMHYGDSALPHHVIARRMKKTLAGAVQGDQ
jgi:uncharacterized protein (DUF302 family)